MFKKTIILMTILLLALAMGHGAIAQEMEADYEFTFGKLVKKEAGKITIEEFDYDLDRAQNFDYLVNPKTIFENVNGMQDLEVGIEIEIFYELKNNARIAHIISKSVYEDDTEMSDSFDNVEL